jgi:hypothetical protein
MPTRSKLSAGLYLLVVFLSGALVGGLSYRLYSVNTVAAITGGVPKTSPEEFRRRYIEAIRAKVNLDPQQIERVNQIMDDARTQFDQVRAKSRTEMQAIEAQRNEKMNAILRDDQKPAYAAFRAERDRLRQQAREKQPKK